jgi:ComF family protein
LRNFNNKVKEVKQNMFFTTLKTFLTDLRLVFFPTHCLVCGRRLTPHEEHICAPCFMDLPLTNYNGTAGNPIERLFWAKIPIVRGNALFHYHPENAYTNVIVQLKYNERTDLGIYLGRLMAKQVEKTDFFNGIDYIIPIPLSARRMRQRGYNQSEYIAKGIQQITQIPIHTKAVKRIKNNVTQTHLNHEQRAKNVANIFQLTQPITTNNDHELKEKHILLIDDVLTTGSTIMACATILATIPGIKISIYTASVAGRHGAGVNLDQEVLESNIKQFKNWTSTEDQEKTP